jgi:diaminohydroxyphosphoribosylaminopyrimidine deaminase/5-amino-6-(5-phosphoribosylamino)uracil reductase
MADVLPPELEEAHMRRALELARLGIGQTAPNPMVGAVLVRGGVVVGEGYHARFGEAHAEVRALTAAGERARGATMFVTLEPCAHIGKTPPCADAVIRAGVSRVVIAMTDPNRIAAGGVAKLRNAGIDVSIGVLEADAKELNAAYAHALESARPWVTLKMAVSLDCAIADGTQTTTRITAGPARRYAHTLRAAHDAVAVGMGTVRIDDPQLTVREAPAPRVPPTRVIFSRSGRLSLTSTLANSIAQGPVIVTAEALEPEYERALRDHGVEVLIARGIPESLTLLRERGLRSILVEGGAVIAGELLEAGLVDRLVLVQAPIILGRGAVHAFAFAPAMRGADAVRWRVVSREVFGDDIATTYAPPAR